MSQKIKNIFGIAGIVVILVLAFVSVRWVRVYEASKEPTTYRSFSVSAEGEIVAVPDIGQFNYTVITEGGTDIAKIQKENVEKTNAINEFLKQSEIDEKDLKTVSYNLSPKYTYYPCAPESGPCKPQEITGYTVTQSVSVKVRDLGKAGDILGGVVEKGANSVSQLSFTIDDEDSVKNGARAQAIQKAEAKARAIAKSAGFKLGKILSISEGGYQPYYYGGYDSVTAYGMEAKSEMAPAPTLQPGSQEVKVNVTIQYEIR